MALYDVRVQVLGWVEVDADDEMQAAEQAEEYVDDMIENGFVSHKIEILETEEAIQDEEEDDDDGES
jgi:hypothetical protein